MKEIECIAKILPDGSLTVPENIRKKFGSDTHVKVKLALDTPSRLDPQKGMQIFKSLGKNAVPGDLPDASTNHDEYLYRTRK